MAMPTDFDMIGNFTSEKNHIAQNVCVSTAAEMTKQIVKFLEGKNTLFYNVGSDEYIIQDHRKNDWISKRQIPVELRVEDSFKEEIDPANREE